MFSPTPTKCIAPYHHKPPLTVAGLVLLDPFHVTVHRAANPFVRSPPSHPSQDEQRAGKFNRNLSSPTTALAGHHLFDQHCRKDIGNWCCLVSPASIYGLVFVVVWHVLLSVKDVASRSQSVGDGHQLNYWKRIERFNWNGAWKWCFGRLKQGDRLMCFE